MELDLQEADSSTPDVADLGTYMPSLVCAMTLVDGGNGMSTTVWGDDGEYHP